MSTASGADVTFAALIIWIALMAHALIVADAINHTAQQCRCEVSK